MSTHHHSWGKFKMTPEGLRVVTDGGLSDPICGPFEILGRSRDANSHRWGRVLHWKDPDGRDHVESIADTEIHPPAQGLVSRLVEGGLFVEASAPARSKLMEYINGCDIVQRVTLVERTGWHMSASGPTFVLPGYTLPAGTNNELWYVGSQSSTHQQTGTLKAWQDGIGRLAGGQSRLMLAIATALAGPLIDLCERESGGLHFYGPSSCGKTTCAQAAASVWGGANYLRSWTATANGLEAAAASMNGCALILDEASAADPRAIADALYRLANGIGKARADRTGGARLPQSWRVSMLSTGEEPLEVRLQSGGQVVRAGQTVRIIDVPADAGFGFGCFNNPGSELTAHHLATAIKTAANAAHGTAGPAFITHLARQDPAEIKNRIKKALEQFKLDFLPPKASGQVQRVAERFALIGAAAVLATEAGIVSWTRNEGWAAAGGGFRAWLDTRGHAGPQEEKRLIAQVRAFIESHGQSRFQPVENPFATVNNRAGFRRDSNGQLRHYVLPEVFKTQVLEGFDSKWACELLILRHLLVPGKDSNTTVISVGGTSCRVYELAPDILSA